MQKLDLFPRPALFTLTIDRQNFSGPIDAFLVVTSEGYIRRLMRLLEVDAWAWTLELQMNSGDGWPHWHIVLNLPRGGLDLPRAWRLWRDKWELGGLDLQRKRTNDARHAMLYATKYLTKYPEAGFPEWVLTFDRRIRWVSCCRSVGRLVADQEPTAESSKVTADQAESLPRQHRSLAVRMADCGQTVDFMREYDSGDETSREFFGRMPLDVFEAAGRGSLEFQPRKLDDGRRFILADAENFVDLGNEMAGAAHRPAARLNTPRRTREAIERQRAIVAGKRVS
ncbi:MAG: hypothetical protein AAGI68_00560 [Planctomycetota bacterium]